MSYLVSAVAIMAFALIASMLYSRSVGEFGRLVQHSGEEWIYLVEGRVEINTEFYDKLCLAAGQSVYMDSSMGHAIVVGEGCTEATVIGVCSSAQEDHLRELIDAHAETPRSDAADRPARS